MTKETKRRITLYKADLDAFYRLVETGSARNDGR